MGATSQDGHVCETLIELDKDDKLQKKIARQMHNGVRDIDETSSAAEPVTISRISVGGSEHV
jgi:hypothetical protein